MNKKKEKIIELYKTGNFTMRDIGKKYKMTRQRVSQICKEHVAVTKKEKAYIIKQRRIRNIIKRYGSEKEYSKILKRRAALRILKKERKGKWSLKYDCCTSCGTTERKYKVKGECSFCYNKNRYKDPKYKATHAICVKRYQEKNKEKIKKYTKKYLKEYYKKNKEKIGKKREEYYTKYPEKKVILAAYSKEYNKRHDVIVRKKEWAEKNKDKIAIRMKKYYKSPEVKTRRRELYQENKEQLREKRNTPEGKAKRKEWYQKNKEQLKEKRNTPENKNIIKIRNKQNYEERKKQ